MFQVVILNNQNQLKTYKIQLKFILVLSKYKIVDYTHKLVILKIHRTAFVFDCVLSVLFTYSYSGLKPITNINIYLLT